jgi:hypothetical protein
MDWPIKIQGRFVTEAEVEEVRMLLASYPLWNRSRLSCELCIRWNWRRLDGQIKDMACRELLRKLEFRNLIKLPPRLRPGPGRLPKIDPVTVDQGLISCLLSDIMPVKIVNARDYAEYEKAFNHLMKHYHYLSYGRPVGQNMKYLIIGRDERFLGCLLFGAAAWKMEDRDRWIGWPSDVRERNLGLICNNTRFLIFDWVKVPHLASYALGACLRRLPCDWKRRYGTDIAIVETFVDTTRYLGTCYKAANWLKIGRTKGRSRQDRNNKLKVPIKDLFVYPLRRDFRKLLLA